MQELLRKIRANAASRLTLPTGKTAASELIRYKAFLKLETHRLKMLHRAGAGGLETCQTRSEILDLIITSLWQTALGLLSPQARKEFKSVALVAIGGYGRAELNPHSDIDFMFLHQGQIAAGKPLPHLAAMIDGILYPLWDLGLKIGHSVRDLEDCVSVANSDMQSKTSLIESRLVIGDQALFDRFQKTLVKKCVQGHVPEYIQMRLCDQDARRAKFGNSASMQEPNLKNGCGGLRDYQNLLWMAFFKYQSRSLADLQKHELTTESERKQLESAYDYLLRVRTEMHYHTNRATDVLTKSIQPAIAWNLGYKERSPSLRIEAFMRDVYRHLRNIYLITRTLEQRMALFPQEERLVFLRRLIPGARKASPEEVDGFRFVDGEIHADSPRVFREQPRRLIRVFRHAQQRGLRLHPDLAQMIRGQLGIVNRGFLNDVEVRETFLAILNERGNVAPVLRAMHEVDFLGKYLPEFGKLTCLVQHEFYHQYTADEHTLMCIEQLDKIWHAQRAPQSAYTPLFQQLERPYLLYLALLLHDTGKKEGHGNHTEVSVRLASRVARRLGLDSTTAHTLRLVIEHHLLMASVSQRRDLDDMSVIRHFAQEIETVETLSVLTLHTFVDSLATSDKLWNGFKDSLLWTLHSKARRLMTDGEEFLKAEDHQREMLMSEVRRKLPSHISQEELEAHFISLPPRYFNVFTVREVLSDLEVAHQFMHRQIDEAERALSPVVSWQDEPNRGYNIVRVCTWDRMRLFVKIAGSFSAAGLSILTAQIFTRADGIVLDTFFVVDARTGALAGPEQREQFGVVLETALTGTDVDFRGLIRKQHIVRPSYVAYLGEQMPTSIRFDNEASERRTVIEIETEDRVGLLFVISQSLAKLGLDISTARIQTEKGAAIDSFYVRDTNRQKVMSPDRQKVIERELRAGIQQLDEPVKAAREKA